jgi:hypothetical protein
MHDGGETVTAFKWASALISVAALALDVLANLRLAALTGHVVPEIVNMFAVGGATLAAVVAFVAHLYGRLDAKLDLTIELLVGRFDEVETRVGDRNSGFVEGYLLRRCSDTSLTTVDEGAG